MTLLDWGIIVLFFGMLTAIGVVFSRKNKNINDYFLAGRSMPAWLVSLAVVGTSISAGTFVGAPEISYEGNLTYLMLSVGAVIGGLMAALIVGVLVVLSLQPYFLPIWTAPLFGHAVDLAWPWWIVVGGSISFITCSLGKPLKK